MRKLPAPCVLKQAAAAVVAVATPAAKGAGSSSDGGGGDVGGRCGGGSSASSQAWAAAVAVAAAADPAVQTPRHRHRCQHLQQRWWQRKQLGADGRARSKEFRMHVENCGSLPASVECPVNAI